MQTGIDLLIEACRIILLRENFKKKLTAIIEAMAFHLKMERMMLTILNRKTDEIFIETACGLTKDEIARGVYQAGEGITGNVIQKGKARIIPQISTEPMFLNRTQARDSNTQEEYSYICVPIQTTDEVIGTLSGEKAQSDEDELLKNAGIMTIVAAMIAQSVKIHQIEHEERELLRREKERIENKKKDCIKISNMVCNSGKMDMVFRLISKIRKTASTVLILGESGVGKELVANAIHCNSRRADNPFIKFNCSALPENLIESELFGHKKGAFTGAHENRTGRFEEANHGTIFLDEIGELSLAVQTKLLRVLQERIVEKVGSSQPIKLDVRIIAATNRDLEKMVQEGLFREDLYYRLNVFPITIPPLRHRKTDILPLANHFIEKFNKENQINIRRISTPAIDLLMRYHWPGNVRELQNTIERAVLLSEDDVIHSYLLPPTLQSADSSGTEDYFTLSRKLETVEKEYLIEAIKNSRGNLADAARKLGLTERVMGLRAKKYKIDFRQYRN